MQRQSLYRLTRRCFNGFLRSASGRVWLTRAGLYTAVMKTSLSVRNVLWMFVLACGSSVALAQPPAAPNAEPPRIGQKAPKPRTPGAIRVASYNVENLFDDKDDPALTGELDDVDDRKPESQLKAVGEAIRRIDADIIALQEIESLEALNWFREAHLAGLGYDHVVSLDAGDDRGIENAVISRFPLKDPEIWLDLPLKGEHPKTFGERPNEEAGKPFDLRRSPLRVTVEVPAQSAGDKPYELTLFVVHHKSGRVYSYWRDAEATKIIELAAEFQKSKPAANILILGDFNAETFDHSVTLYLDAGYKDVFEGRDPGNTLTMSHASGRMIDLILYNSSAAPEIIRDSRFVLGTPQIPEDVDWRTAPKPDGYASDHVPVVVDIKPKD